MQKKSLNFLVIALCLILASCSRKSDNIPQRYILSNSPDIQKLEREDHKFCISLDLNSGSTNKNFSTNLYWHCRLSMAKYKLSTNLGSPTAMILNEKITDLITRISQNLSETKESFFIKENKRVDAKDHEKCVSMGYDFDILDRVKTDQYLLCRKRLIDDDQLDPAYGMEDYLKYPNRSYNLSFVLDTRLDKENKRFADAQKNYPYCVKFFKDPTYYKQCTIAQDQSKQCFSEINAKQFHKESEQKTLCQKSSYIKFPDSYLKDVDQRKKDIARTKTNADLYNKNSFTALGLMADDIELFESEETVNAQDDARQKQRKLEKNVNSKRGLYTREELTRLRQKYIIACQQNSENLVQDYVDSLKKECAEIGNYKIREEML